MRRKSDEVEKVRAAIATGDNVVVNAAVEAYIARMQRPTWDERYLNWWPNRVVFGPAWSVLMRGARVVGHPVSRAVRAVSTARKREG